MFYDIASFPWWLLAVALTGVVVGWATYADMPRRSWFEGWVIWGVIAFVIGLVVAVLKLLPGKAGLWLEIALLMMFLYVLGCFLGGWLKSMLLKRARQPAEEAAQGVAPQASALVEADALAAQVAAQAERDRLAAQAAAKAEAERQAAAAQAERDRLAAEAATKAEAERQAAAAAQAKLDRLAAEADADPEADYLAAAVIAEQDRLIPETAAPGEAEPQAAAADAAGIKPPALEAPQGVADDLKLIKGIGPNNERTLNDLGIHHFSQIADWSLDHATWIGDQMAFPGRIERERWIPQAKLLAAGFETDHSAGVKSGAIKIDESADVPMSEAEANSLAAGMPALMPAVEGEERHAGARPLGLAAPRGGIADDLKRIKGIGKQNEARLHGLGVWHFDQIAAWSAENVKWVSSYLAFAGRIDRERWIAQAKDLVAGRNT